MKKVFTLLLLLITTISIAQESVILRLNIKQGEKYVMKMNMLQDMGEIMKMNMIMDFPFEVKSDKNDVYNLEMGISRIQSDIEQAGMVINYDSSKKEEEMSEMEKGMHSKMKDLLDFLVNIEMDNQCNVTSTKLINGAGDPSQITSNSTFTKFPKEAVKVGSKWSDETTNSGMKMVYNYTVKSIESDIVTVVLNGVISDAGTGTIKGDLIIDKTTGLANKQTLVMDIEAGGQKIASTITVTTTKL